MTLDVQAIPHTLIMTRRTLLGALKCAFRELRRELDTILAIAAVIWREMGLVERGVGCREVLCEY